MYFTYDSKQYSIECDDSTDNVNNLERMLGSDTIKKAVANILCLIGYENNQILLANYVGLHTRNYNEPNAKQGGPRGDCSSICFLKNNDLIARIRILQRFDIEKSNTQNAWWFIDTDDNGTSGTEHRGKKYQQFLTSGKECSASLDDFYNELINIHKLKKSDSNNKSAKCKPATSKGKIMNLNTIKYGPPGTGKTFSLVKDIQNLFQSSELKEQNLTQFSSIAALKNKLGNQIDFITFHQSYSYEDFIEGIKAEITPTQQVNYVVKNGVFKKISRRAYLHKLINQLDNPDLKHDTEELLQLYAEYTDQALAAMGSHGLIEELRALINNATNTASTAETPKYVLCIDEINRGNLSRIFGEIMTCIENSKRQGSKETIPVTLPYSGDQFVIPDNLYIIGTMNTADRSLVKLDAAMRRRFDFQLIKPDPTLLKGISEDINLQEFLTTVNSRISEKLGQDFELGHAYFMNVTTKEEFAAVILNNIIPLLEEYFFNNRLIVQEVLAGTPAQQYY